MQRRQTTLGEHGPSVSVIGLGCWGMSGPYGPADETESVATLHRALDLGITLLDTADSYGEGHNESLLGRALHDRRSEFRVATKTGWVKRVLPSGETWLGVDARPERIRSACDASLARLQTDVIDLYYQHRADPDVPLEDSVGAMADLVRAGKVIGIGLSEVSPTTLRRAHGVHPITALQSEYSLWTREPESDVIPACRALGVTFVAFSPLGRGFLTGGLTDRSQIGSDDWRANNPRFTAENIARNAALLAPLQEIALARGLTVAQVALAWVLAQPGVLPIPGVRRRTHLEANVAAIDVVLTPEETARLEAAFPPGAAAGARYTDAMARWAGL